MAGIARIVSSSGIHVTMRDNRRESIFFEDGNQDIYCDLLAEQTLTHPARTSGDMTYTSGSVSQLIDYYTYDGLGQQIKHTNNVLSTTETTDYDADGRITKSVSFGGETTTYSYTWNAMTELR